MRLEEKEALLELLTHVFESDDRIQGLVYLDIQKIFYHLRGRLSDENSVTDLLPYYWYIDGTVSDTVQEAVNHGLTADAFETEPTARTGSGEWFEPTGEYTPSADDFDRDDIEVAKREIENVLAEDYDVFADHAEKIEDIYEDAPYEFQRFFKFKILFELERFANGRPMFLGTDGLESQVTTAEAYLPLDSEFDEFNAIFSRYVNTAKRYLGSVSDEDRTLADRFKQLSESVWRLYCQQLRLLEHDRYYDSETDEWEEEYERTKSLVANDLVEFRRLLDIEFEEGDDVTRVPEDSTWGRITADYIGESDLGE
jgi:hypothetical protein